MEAFPLEVIESTANGWNVRIAIPPDSRYFEVHFEVAPILSAVGQFALLTQALCACRAGSTALAKLQAVRFKQSIEPGDELDLTISHATDERARFLLERAGELISKGSCEFRDHA